MRNPDIANTEIGILERITNSSYGNPRYRISFVGERSTRITSSNASFCYGITSLADKRVNVWLTKAGRVEHVEAA